MVTVDLFVGLERTLVTASLLVLEMFYRLLLSLNGCSSPLTLLRSIAVGALGAIVGAPTEAGGFERPPGHRRTIDSIDFRDLTR